MKKHKVSVVLATYNERENIIPLIAAVIKNLKNGGKYDFEIVVVDDNSPDATYDAVMAKYSKDRRVKAIRRFERGLATALRRGIEESSGDVIVMMDTDFSHDPSQLPGLVELAFKYGIGNGSRFIKGGRFTGKKYRSVVTRLLQLFTRVMLGVPATDFTNGFVAIKRDTLQGLSLDRIFFGYGDYCFRLFYYAHRAHKNKFRIAEMPSYYKPRVHGQSKTREFKTGLQYVASILRLRLGISHKANLRHNAQIS
ncbi:glycosyltransferase [Candidatus Woesearchaeota archaeon]|nr:glycosyltransferase [Candidatus Woesearchaeota archaeon]